MGERFYGFGCDALDAVLYALCKRKDGHLGYRFLVDIGVIPRQTLTTQPSVPEKHQSQRVFEIPLQLTEVVRERARIFGMPMPDLDVLVSLEEIRHHLNLTKGTNEPVR